MRTAAWFLGTFLACAGLAAAEGQKSGLDPDGFIQRWVVLLPIPLGNGEGVAGGLDREQVRDEAKLKPRVGDKVRVGEKELTWKEHANFEHLLDFNAIMGGQTDDSVAYAVAYVDAPEEMPGVKMKTGSDDMAKVYLNGKEVLRRAEERAANKDQDTTVVTLRKGVNVLVVKVVNAKGDWGFCVRFTRGDDKPITNLRVKTSD